jgi:ribosomal protein S24E
MNFQVISEKENPLFKRKEILTSLDYQGGSTPSKADLQKTLAEHFKVNIDSVEISRIISENGLPRGKAWIKIWQDKKIQIYSEEKKKEPSEEQPKEVPKETSVEQPKEE